MIIEFKDPGYDWTAPLITIGIFGVILLVAAFFGLLYHRRGRRSNADYVAYWTLGVAAVWLGFGVGLGGFLTATNIWADQVEVAKYEALREAGLTGIQIEVIRYEADTITGYLDGDEFVGTIEDLYYPKDHAYKITEMGTAK